MFPRILVVGLVVAGLVACAGPGTARTSSGAQAQTGAQTSGSSQAAATPAAGAGTGGAQSAAAVTGQKAPGPYTANGQVDGSSGNVSLTMLDSMKFQPNTITGVKPGEKVTVNLQNSGAVVHDFLAPSLGVTTATSVNPGQKGSVTFTAPSQPGTYQFWCNQPGHGEAGMVGEVIVS
jgi:uncharacterized cupredoxin-like copper-binding protein